MQRAGHRQVHGAVGQHGHLELAQHEAEIARRLLLDLRHGRGRCVGRQDRPGRPPVSKRVAAGPMAFFRATRDMDVSPWVEQASAGTRQAAVCMQHTPGTIRLAGLGIPGLVRHGASAQTRHRESPACRPRPSAVRRFALMLGGFRIFIGSFPWSPPHPVCNTKTSSWAKALKPNRRPQGQGALHRLAVHDNGQVGRSSTRPKKRPLRVPLGAGMVIKAGTKASKA